MKRNEDRIWFDRGYQQAVSDKKIESFIPKVVGLWVVLGLTYFEPAISVTFLSMYSIFMYFEWNDEKEYGVDYEPPETWE